MSEATLQQHASSIIKASRSPKQILQQDICQKYGWSCTITTTKNPLQKHEVIEEQGEIGTLCSIELNQVRSKNEQTNVTKTINDELVSSCSVTPTCQIQLQYLCTVVVGYRKIYHFVSNVSEIDVCQQAIHGLQSMINEEEQKPLMSLQEFLSTTQLGGSTTGISTGINTTVPLSTIPIYDSHDVRNWDYFWSHRPTVVGIDTEGNNCIPPIIIQIAVIDINTNETYCIIEAPKRKKSYHPKNTSSGTSSTDHGASTANATISNNLKRLLNDTSIVKVFCDNFSHKDKVVLGIHNATSSDVTNGQNNQSMYGFQSEPQTSVIDLECVMNEMYGPVKVARGLSRIVALTIAPNVQICKSSSPNTPSSTSPIATTNTASMGRWKNIKKFALIEQGKIKPITNIFRDLSPMELQYAAGDAYATLLVYNYLLSIQ